MVEMWICMDGVDEMMRNVSKVNERPIPIDRSLNVFHNTFQTNLTS